MSIQTFQPDEILVVNNASTDGTSEMLRSEFPEVQQLNLLENSGGAGGFHSGIKWAFEEGFDWISVMDDDGYPESTCLEKLLNYPDPQLVIRAPLAISDQNPNALAFKMFPLGHAITTPQQAEEIAISNLLAYINPFNGVVISNSSVRKIGLPEKGLFMWGDEYEYFLRMKHAKLKLGTIVDARFYHPPDRMKADQVRMIMKEYPVYYADHPFKDYLILRNHAYILKKYRGWPGWLAHVCRYMIFYGRLSRFDQIVNVLTASIHGARADFSHHHKYLR